MAASGGAGGGAPLRRSACESLGVVGIFCLLHTQHVRGPASTLARAPRGFLFVVTGTVGAAVLPGPGWGAEAGGQGAQGGRFLPRPSEALSEWLPDVPGTDSRWRGIRATVTPTHCAGCYPSGSRGPPGCRRRAAASPSRLEPELEPKDSFKVTGRGTSAAVTPTGLQCPVLGGDAVSFALSEKSPSTREARCPGQAPAFPSPVALGVSRAACSLGVSGLQLAWRWRPFASRPGVESFLLSSGSRPAEASVRRRRGLHPDAQAQRPHARLQQLWPRSRSSSGTRVHGLREAPAAEPAFPTGSRASPSAWPSAFRLAAVVPLGDRTRSQPRRRLRARPPRPSPGSVAVPGAASPSLPRHEPSAPRRCPSPVRSEM